MPLKKIKKVYEPRRLICAPARTVVKPEIAARERYPRITSLIDPTSGKRIRLDNPAIVWDLPRQNVACDMGFFLHHGYPDHDVVVVPLTGRLKAYSVGTRELRAATGVSQDRHKLPILKPFENAQEVMDHLTKLSFHGDPFAIEALNFIIQQDVMGYPTAWVKEIEKYHPNIKWYRDKKIAERAVYQERMEREAINRAENTMSYDAWMARRAEIDGELVSEGQAYFEAAQKRRAWQQRANPIKGQSKRTGPGAKAINERLERERAEEMKHPK